MRKLHPYTILGMLYVIRFGVLIWAAIAYGWQLAVILFLTVVVNEIVGKR